ncbi:hypothetical protein [Nocardiopsis synnemataformans]|uniref:hypothetical protein n=1 Tax=Nocardiopsis synnemataformans TaxID=61305 RepID=UPI003EBAB586
MKLFPNELFVAPGEGVPTVLMVVERGGKTVFGRMVVTETLTPEEVQERYGWASPVWHYAATEGDRDKFAAEPRQFADEAAADDVPLELCVEGEDVVTRKRGSRARAFALLVGAFRHRNGGDAA